MKELISTIVIPHMNAESFVAFSKKERGGYYHRRSVLRIT